MCGHPCRRVGADHAAGAFDQLLTLPSISAGPSARVRVIGTLERLQRASQEPGHARSAPFPHLLAMAIGGLRRGESVAVVTLKLKARLTQRYPSLVITPSLPLFRATVHSAELFGLTFTSKDAMSAHDRRCSARPRSCSRCWRTASARGRLNPRMRARRSRRRRFTTARNGCSRRCRLS